MAKNPGNIGNPNSDNSSVTGSDSGGEEKGRKETSATGSLSFVFRKPEVLQSSGISTGDAEIRLKKDSGVKLHYRDNNAMKPLEEPQKEFLSKRVDVDKKREEIR
jgi:hypothetical protein